MAMSFEEYWQDVLKDNPKMKNDVIIKMTVEEFRKRLNLSWRNGVRYGRETKPIFDQIFGKL